MAKEKRNTVECPIKKPSPLASGVLVIQSMRNQVIEAILHLQNVKTLSVGVFKHIMEQRHVLRRRQLRGEVQGTLLVTVRMLLSPEDSQDSGQSSCT
jgi:hypothetical protein